MTHDELLEEIDDRFSDTCDAHCESCSTKNFPIKALRAIVELHKPFKDSWKEEMQCSYCVDLCHSETGLGCEDIDAVYPCLTIELIEKELS